MKRHICNNMYLLDMHINAIYLNNIEVTYQVQEVLRCKRMHSWSCCSHL